MRLQHEWANFNHKGMFVTLTYNESHAPAFYSLKKRHLQNFFKRLRKSLNGQKIKYFACGEYGNPPQLLPNGKYSVGYRPHYHIILLGLAFTNECERNYVIQNWPYCDWTVDRTRRSFGYVSSDSMRYTADYMLKQDMFYSKKKQIKQFYPKEIPFQTMSKGIGKDWVEAHTDEIQKTGTILFEGREISLPRYYASKVEVPQSVKDNNIIKANDELATTFGYDPFLVTYGDYGRGILIPNHVSKIVQAHKNMVAKKAQSGRQKI